MHTARCGPGRDRAPPGLGALQVFDEAACHRGHFVDVEADAGAESLGLHGQVHQADGCRGIGLRAMTAMAWACSSALFTGSSTVTPIPGHGGEGKDGRGPARRAGLRSKDIDGVHAVCPLFEIQAQKAAARSAALAASGGVGVGADLLAEGLGDGAPPIMIFTLSRIPAFSAALTVTHDVHGGGEQGGAADQLAILFLGGPISLRDPRRCPDR